MMWVRYLQYRVGCRLRRWRARSYAKWLYYNAGHRLR